MNPANEREALAAHCVELALAAGAGQVEAVVLDGEEFEADVRLGEVETLKEAGARGVSVRVLLGQRSGSASTSDVSEAGLQRMVRSAVELAGIAMEDRYAGLPDEAELGAAAGDLALYSESVEQLVAEQRIELARQAERSAMAADPRINNSEGASFGAYLGWRAFANSKGFLGSYRGSTCSLSVVPVAQENGFRERDSWSAMGRAYPLSETAEQVGRKAAERVLRRLGARKAATQKAPVIFEPRVARSLLSHVFSAVNGNAVWQKSSFLAGRHGQVVASPKLTVVDDATLPGLPGSAPFDGEGVRTRRTVVIREGVLESFLLNGYAARKLGLATTGNAGRGTAGSVSTGHGNLYAAPGTETPASLIAGLRNGFYVTELLGSGVNIGNGDYSRGAAGVWIENGELAWPVHEVTISGNLLTMLKNIEAVASDLEFRGSIACPTLLIGEMTISGN